jgi:hypothetical protein
MMMILLEHKEMRNLIRLDNQKETLVQPKVDGLHRVISQKLKTREELILLSKSKINLVAQFWPKQIILILHLYKNQKLI